MASSIDASTSGAGGVITTADNTGILNLQTASTTAVTVDASQNVTVAGNTYLATSSGNVGIGTTSPTALLNVNRTTTGSANAIVISRSSTNNNDSQSISWQASDLSLNYASIGAVATSTTGTLTFNTASSGTNTERMRITSSGTVLFGTTSAPSSGLFRALGNASADFSFGPQTGVGTNAFVVYNAGTTTGVYLVAGNTSWTSSSDERVKDIIEPITNAAEKVSTLRTVIGKYKTDEDNVRRPFLIAQDVQAVLPEAVDASKPDNLGVQYTDVIPLLTAAIKEQQTIINDLKARVTALEAK